MQQKIHFILGGMDEATFLKVSAQVRDWYNSRIPKADTLTYRHTDDVLAAIKFIQPTGPLVIIGHSFGGDKAVEVAAGFMLDSDRKVDSLVLYDPVNRHEAGIPNTKGYTIPNNVNSAVCYFRDPCNEAPFSGKITSWTTPTTTAQNSPYEGDHSFAVWNGNSIAFVKETVDKLLALAEQPKHPPIDPLKFPFPSPTKITIHYDDGSDHTYMIAAERLV